MAFSRVKYFNTIALPALVICMLLVSCENDLKKIKEISELELIKPVERSTGVEIIYSDSTYVKSKIQAPLMLYHTIDTPYYEMPKGVKIIFYDKNLKQVNTITSDYAILKEGESIAELHKNVVAVNEQGDIFKSEELIWEQKEKKIHSSQPVQILMKNGDIINGTSFESNESFYPYTIQQSTGIFNVKENPMEE